MNEDDERERHGGFTDVMRQRSEYGKTNPTAGRRVLTVQYTSGPNVVKCVAPRPANGGALLATALIFFS